LQVSRKKPVSFVKKHRRAHNPKAVGSNPTPATNYLQQ
jgi:hypothetical protein